MRPSRIHHVAIICSDYERSKAFYTGILGLHIIEETYRAERASYKLDLQVGDFGSGRIELFSFPGAPARLSHPEALGLRHLAFEVPDLDESITGLMASGVAVEPTRIDPITGKRFTFFMDPDGLPLELYEA